jgi:hypothetical protein
MLFILNNFLKILFLKHHRWIYKHTFSVGILQRIEKYLLEMPQSSTSLQTETFRWYFIESWKIFTSCTIITDTYTDKYRPLAFHRELKNIYFICHDRQRNISSGNFFWRVFFVCKTIGIFFTDIMWIRSVNKTVKCCSVFKRRIN